MPLTRPSPLQRALSLLVPALLCSACVTGGVKEAETPTSTTSKETKEVAEAPKAVAPAPIDKAKQELASGIASYEDGNYKLAARQLQGALALGLAARVEQAQAHKYLAFMHCVGGRERLCREAFRKALAADPAFDLTPAEAGHPTWGPVFRKLKGAGKPTAK